MPYLPYQKLRLRSTLPATEIVRRLEEQVQPRKLLRWGAKGEEPYFEGTVRGNQFDIQRVIRHRNSFLPQITGTISVGEGEGLITLRMRPHLLVIVFLLIWSTGVSIGLLLIVYVAIRGESRQLVWALFPLGMLAFAYGLVYFSFDLEAARARKYLLAIWEAELIA